VNNTILFGKRLSTHKMTTFSKNFGVAWSLWPPMATLMFKSPKLKYESYILVEFCQFLQSQGLNRETNSLTITWDDFHPNSH